jgi:hypothetical protein
VWVTKNPRAVTGWRKMNRAGKSGYGELFARVFVMADVGIL